MVEEKKNAKPVEVPRSGLRNGRWTALLVLLGAVILLCGLVIGSSGTVLVFRDKITRGGPPFHEAGFMARQIQNTYGLSKEQARKVEDIFSNSLQAMQKIREENERKLAETRDEMLSEMKKVLTAEQYARWRAEFETRQKIEQRRQGGAGLRRRGQGRRGPMWD